MSAHADGSLPAAVREGIDAFNAGQFFECHEILELEWKAEREPFRALYQGMIQAAIVLHHVRQGKYDGASIMLRRALPRLAAYAPAWRGIDVARLLADLETYAAELSTMSPERFRELALGPFPRIHVLQPPSGT